MLKSIDDRKEEVLAVEELKTAKPCPFCNRNPVHFLEEVIYSYQGVGVDDDTKPRNDGEGKYYTFAVFCLSCLVNGPIKGSREQALTYWNRRF